jgi:phosphatidyl-myo-inositol dimannoside synthase
MGCGCPVIASDLPAIHDSITHKENGFLVHSGNPKALAKTIITALDDPELRVRLAREGRKRAIGRFHWEVVAEKYAIVYNQLSNYYF